MLTASGAAIVRCGLPPGDGYLQLVAHDGFHSVACEPMPVTVPDPGVQLAVLNPVHGNTYPAGQEVRTGWPSGTSRSRPPPGGRGPVGH